MSVAPRELLDAARAIPQTDEASRRAIISRVYYAAFHAANEFHESLPAPGNPGTAKGEHAILIARLSAPLIKSGLPEHMVSRRIGGYLNALRALRIKADYHPREAVTDADVEAAWFKAQDIFAACYPSVGSIKSAPQP